MKHVTLEEAEVVGGGGGKEERKEQKGKFFFFLLNFILESNWLYKNVDL